MRKGKDIIGKPIIAYDTGEKIHNIIDLIFDQNDNSLQGFLITESGWFSDAKVLPLGLVKALGIDAVIIPAQEAIAPSRNYDLIHRILDNNNALNGTRIMTTDGRNLGKLVDLYFDESTGKIEGYETSGGLFADAYSGRSFVPAPKTLKIGRDVAFVPIETIALMEEQVGGIKAVMQTASQQMRSTAKAGDRLQEASQVASERFANDPLCERLDTTVAGWAVEQALGKRSQRAVYTPSGYIIVAQGQIVTAQTIERAKIAHEEAALLDAAGLSTTAAQSQINLFNCNTGDRLQTNATLANDRIQSGAANMWDKVKETANELQGRSAQAIEQQRIRGALGRPTTRVILDRHDEVILNVGELIGHKSIDGARAAGMLDVLLDSVYTEPPQLSLQELKAPDKGRLAL
jgi:uncharacterized protein YrrD/pyrimidine deaminase RibD-like protein